LDLQAPLMLSFLTAYAFEMTVYEVPRLSRISKTASPMKTLVSTLRRNHRLQKAIYLALAPGLLTFSVPLQANPEGAQVVIGDVGFQGMGTANLDIFNNSQTAIINWQNFSIDQGEVTSIHQATSATTLNRVVSGNPSAIYGQLKAEAGNVMVINPNGVIVHAGGTVNVAGMLTVSTLDISDSEFLSGGIGRFRGNTSAGVENYGSVSSSNGDVVFLGNFLRNEGEVSALGGTVAFGAGGDILVGTGGGGVISVQAGGEGGDTGIVNAGTIDAASVELKATGNVYALAIQNDGVVRAKGYNFSGGKLTLSAGSNGRIINTGNMEARNVDGRGGQIDISGGRVEIGAGTVDASGDYGRAGGSVAVSGSEVSVGSAASIQANGATGGSVSISSTGDTTVGGSLAATGGLGAGGVVKVEGRDIAVGSEAKVDVSGQTGGGTVVIGGGFQGRDANVRNAENLTVARGSAIIADAVEGGSGGVVVLWSDGDTLFEGDVSAHGVAKGGFVEISGKQNLAVGGTVDLAADSGLSGTLLLDPTNVTISALGANAIGGSTISNVFLSNLLDAGTNVVISTNFGGAADAGDIVIGRTSSSTEAAADRIEWYQDSVGTPGGTLTLLAMGDIRFNTSVHSAGTGGINAVAGWDGVTGWDGMTGLNGLGQFVGYAQNSPVFNIGAVLSTFADNFGTAGNLANDAAGLRSGSVFLGSANGRIGVDVGSRSGATNIAAHDLILTGSGVSTFGWAQLGFHDSGYEYALGSTYNTVRNEWWGDAAGNVTGKNYITLLGGTEFTAGAPAVAAGQYFRGAGFGATGDIRAELSGRLDMRGGLNNAYTQIGHGASVADGVEPHNVQGALASAADPTLDRITRDGIRMNPGSNRRSYFSSTWRTNYAGDLARTDADITVNVKEDALLFGAAGFEFVDEQVTDVRSGTYSVIGHGGAENHGSYHGDISLIADGATPEGFARGSAGIGIQLLGGRGSKSHAQIGHGSSVEGNLRIFDQSRSGDITVIANTGAIRLVSHTQAVRSGDLNSGFIITGSTPTPASNTSDDSNTHSAVQIGHGGNYADLAAAGGNFSLPGGGNVTLVGNNSATGDINVSAGGTYRDPEDPTSRVGIKIEAGNRGRYYAQIGHGGINHNATATAAAINYSGGTNPFGAQTRAASVGYLGNISVDAKLGDLVVSGGDAFRADRVWGYGFNYSRIGHGGDTARGTKAGNVTVSAGQTAGATDGDINLRAGRMYRSHAQLGHGGFDSAGAVMGYNSISGTAVESANTAAITVIARGDISFISPPAGEVDALNLSVDWANWWFDNNGNQQGSWQVEDRWVLLGHGGRSGVSTIASRQDITVTAGTGDLANADGDVSTGGITFVAGDSTRDFAQLGHGGWTVGANDVNGFTGDIRVTANGGGIRFDASILGIQGSERRTDVTYDGVNLVSALPRRDGNGNPVAGGNAPSADTGIGRGAAAYAQLGHGGYATRGINVGDIIVNAWGGIDFVAAPAAPTVGRVVTNANIVAAIRTGTNLWLPLANLENSVATFGGRYQISDMISSIVPGSINITLSDGTVITDVVRANTDDMATTGDAAAGLFATIGAVTTKVADIDYDRGLVRFNSAFYGANAAVLQALDPLLVTATANFLTAQGQKDEAYVQLGHGGFNSDGVDNKANNLPSNSGLIQIGAAGDINFTGGAAYRNNAQLGHGGRDTRGINAGNISINHVDATHFVGGLSFTAGFGGHRQRDRESYAQLGHGGYDSDGNHFGNITVRGTEAANGVGLLLKAGDRQDAYAQVGHGGGNARSGTGDGANSFGLNGNIDIQVSGDVDVVAGTFRRNLRSTYDDDGRLYAQIGHGGFNTDPSNNDTSNFNSVGVVAPIGTQAAGAGNWGHFGDISVISTAGSINVFGGNNAPLAGRLDSYGNNLGLTDPLGLLVSHGTGAQGGRGMRHYAQIGHGGYATGGNHHGNITVTAGDGAVTVVGGADTFDTTTTKNNYAQIGHGAADAPGNTGLTAETIKVFAYGNNGDVNVYGGTGDRNPALIGNGGNNAGGNPTGDIKIIAERHLNMQSGVGTVFDNWAKIGHSDIFDRQTGTRNGDIEVSVGNNARIGRAIIGHFNHKRDASSAFRSTSGDTFIAVGRNNPFSTGTATITTTNDTVITSALAGLAGSELRIYMPNAASDLLATDTFLNDAFYTRTPAPGSGRSDESVATEHVFIAGLVDEAAANFTPEGAYLGNGFGSYNVFFGAAPIVIPPPVTPPPPIDGFVFGDYYDAFSRNIYLLSYDGYEGQLYSLSWADAMESESDPDTGGWGFENALDRRAGPRREGRIDEDPSILQDERDEELERRREAASRGVGHGGLTYYVFDPATNRYSSFQVFGVPATNLPISQ
jgi:filamentous hemagglutinin family protein